MMRHRSQNLRREDWLYGGCTVFLDEGVKKGTIVEVYSCLLRGVMIASLLTWFGVHVPCTSPIGGVELLLFLCETAKAQYLWRLLQNKY